MIAYRAVTITTDRLSLRGATRRGNLKNRPCTKRFPRLITQARNDNKANSDFEMINLFPDICKKYYSICKKTVIYYEKRKKTGEIYELAA